MSAPELSGGAPRPAWGSSIAVRSSAQVAARAARARQRGRGARARRTAAAARGPWRAGIFRQVLTGAVSTPRGCAGAAALQQPPAAPRAPRQQPSTGRPVQRLLCIAPRPPAPARSLSKRAPAPCACRLLLRGQSGERGGLRDPQSPRARPRPASRATRGVTTPPLPTHQPGKMQAAMQRQPFTATRAVSNAPARGAARCSRLEAAPGRNATACGSLSRAPAQC
jgi:hypothetical protein